MNASWGMFTIPTFFLRLLPAFCLLEEFALADDVAAVAGGEQVSGELPG